ncbi:NADPH-dependent F420 reductase [cf. Phormidesmis sp. LEGE 11477]|uniref:NADPH-dependent F420 reductase n=1 Tax=cf. Phormidesmis sp. LEGE 11477 TaxID=1828680 RepID=UPI0018803173|nr:NAD(P)-binding domain-containing protein [cf. Phormidesmis sp. LEGE 11477]MBE9059538.1 NAD(P)-binding domain-containing protein [cf. Phormidesmis sp. LEGE 11477]
MKIGIIGSGNIGGSLGRLWAKAGHEVFFSSRHPEKLDSLARQAGNGAQAGTTDEAIAFADLIFEAVPFSATMTLPVDALAGKILITASNYYPKRDGDIEINAPSQSEALAKKLSSTAVVKAFNMMFAEEMEARANGETEEKLAIFYAGDNAEAKAVVAQLIEEAQFSPVDAGSLSNGIYFQNEAPLYAQRWSQAEAQQALDKVEA